MKLIKKDNTRGSRRSAGGECHSQESLSTGGVECYFGVASQLVRGGKTGLVESAMRQVSSRGTGECPVLLRQLAITRLKPVTTGGLS